jgi:hypothetical protein
VKKRIAAERGEVLAKSQTTCLAGDAGLDAAKREKVIVTVRQWREEEELPFPDFSPEAIGKMDNRLEYLGIPLNVFSKRRHRV